MANLKVRIAVRIKDKDDEITSMPLYGVMSDATSGATLKTFIDTMLALLDLVTEGEIVGVEACLIYDLPGGLKASPAAGSEIERTGLIPFTLTGLSTRSWSNDIPAFKYSLFVPGTNTIDEANVDVANWLAHLQSGVGTVQYSDPTWGHNLGANRPGQKTFRKHRRQTKRT